MVSRLVTIIMPLLVVSQSFNDGFHHARSVANDQNLINCLNDAEVLKSLVFTAVQNLADGENIYESLDDLKNFWSLFPQWFHVCKGVLNAPEEVNEPFPEIDFDIMMAEEGIYINGILYIPEDVLDKNDSENCMYALYGLANLLSKLKASIEEQDYSMVANIIYSFKGIKDNLKRTCP
ncbi:hypothetical protein SteCoe_23001 [Stentor coeruleus]|uniref:Uncharacterized protein n=1 Tax=Stentor coeruleus TaxID=5963 RepID=A0A1R2BKY5_9CILI|nr:hypothetical protein SteCoe_23001 [Stentor coeruleus]